MLTAGTFFYPHILKIWCTFVNFASIFPHSPCLILTLYSGVVNRTIQAAGCEEGSCLICQVTVQGAAQSQDVNCFLFRAVKEVVLNGSGDRASSVFQLSTLQKEKTKSKQNI